MRFSVVVPVYNGESFLVDCLESVLRQTYDDYEVIIVDDGSADGSGCIADSFAEAHKNVQVLHCGNQGPFLARRSAFKRCMGDYILCLDADDKLRKNALERVSACIDESDADIISFRFSRHDDFSTADDEAFLPKGLYIGADYRLFERAVCTGRSNSLWGKAIRLCRIDMNAAYGALKDFRMGEDLYQLLPIVDSSCSFARIEDVLYYYRPNDGSSTGNFRHSYIADTERVAIRILDYGKRWGIEGEATNGAMKLYVGLTKMLADAVRTIGWDIAKKELEQERAALLNLSPDVSEFIGRLRPDYRALLRAVLSGSLVRVRFVTEASHIGRKVIGRSI